MDWIKFFKRKIKHLDRKFMEHTVHENNALSVQSRQYRLIYWITLELFIVGLIFLYINYYLALGSVFFLLALGLLSIVANLWYLKSSKNLQFCGHFLTIIAYLTAIVGNLIVGGVKTSYFGWFYVIPIIASTILDLRGLLIYTVLCVLTLTFFIIVNPQPWAGLNETHNMILTLVNRYFILVVIVTTLYSLLYENRQYETFMEENNFMLSMDRQKLHYLARHDPLTNLPNRLYYHNYLETLMDNAKEARQSLTLFYMDLDGFKAINDQYGHEAGDKILLLAGKRLQNCMRQKDFLARIGGDEFIAVIIGHKDEASVESVAKRIDKEFTNAFLVNNFQIHCRISVGRASYPEDADTAENLLDKADANMYVIKSQNKMKHPESNHHST